MSTEKEAQKDGKDIEKQRRDPLSNTPSGKEHTLQQLSNDELRERKSSEELKNADKSAAQRKGSPYDLDEPGSDEERDTPIIPDDPIEAEQIESEKLRFGFSFEPKEGQMGDETDDEGDLTADQKKTGNRYKPYLGVDDGEQNEEDTASDQELRVTDSGHIGMAFGEDSYVDNDDDKNNKKKK